MAAGITKIKLLFIGHLNRLHCAKAHLVERLVDICEEPTFSNVKAATEKALAQTEEQIVVLDRIYSILNTEYSFNDCTGLVAFLEDTFSSFQSNIKDPDLSYLLILSYLHRIKGIENFEIEILQLLAEKLNNDEITEILNCAPGNGEQELIAELVALYRNL
jgi:ferritin-like metal-binding protein YciE